MHEKMLVTFLSSLDEEEYNCTSILKEEDKSLKGSDVAGSSVEANSSAEL